eukprot:762819-Hanusia_phi.AAC.2
MKPLSLAFLLVVQVVRAALEFDPLQLSLQSYGDRSVTLSWCQYGNLSLVAMFRLYNISDGNKSVLASFNVSSPYVNVNLDCAEQPSCNCSTVYLTADNLILGEFYNFALSFFVHVSSDGIGQESNLSNTVYTRILDPPSIPLNVSVTPRDGQFLVEWITPVSCGLGAGTDEPCVSLLKGFRIKATTNASSALTSCSAEDSHGCIFQSVLPNVTSVLLQVTDTQSMFALFLQAFNDNHDGAVIRLFPVSLRPRVPTGSHVSLFDHLILEYSWQEGALTYFGEGLQQADFFRIQWTTNADDFIDPVRQDRLQCFSTLNLPMPESCRACKIVRCDVGQVCMRAKARNHDNSTLIVMGCANSSLLLHPQFDCFDVVPIEYSTCSSSLCNDPMASYNESDLCDVRSGERYCNLAGSDWSTRTFLEDMSNTSETLQSRDVAPEIRSMTFGKTSSYVGTVDCPLIEGARYYFRIASCWNSLGCSDFSSMLSEVAGRVQMQAAISLEKSRSGEQGEVNVSFAIVKQTEAPVRLDLALPPSFGFIRTQGSASEGTMCICVSGNQSMMASLPYNRSAIVDFEACTRCNLLSYTLDISHFCDRNCSFCRSSSSKLSIHFGQEGLIFMPGTIFKLTTGLVWNPPFSGSFQGFGLRTFDHSEQLVDVRSDFSPMIIEPGLLDVSSSSSVTSAGFLTNISLSLSSQAHNWLPANSTINVDFPVELDLSASQVFSASHQIDVLSVSLSHVSVSLLEPTCKYPILVTFLNVRNGFFPRILKDFRVQTVNGEGTNLSIVDENLNVSSYAISRGIVYIELEPAMMLFGAQSDLVFNYNMSSSLKTCATSSLHIRFPPGASLQDANISAFSGNLSRLACNCSFHVERTNNVDELVFVYDGESTQSALSAEEHFRFNILNVRNPLYEPAGRYNFSVWTMCEDAEVNATDVSFFLLPSVLKDTTVALSSDVSGTKSNMTVSFQTNNPLTGKIFLSLSSPQESLFCRGDLQTCYPRIFHLTARWATSSGMMEKDLNATMVEVSNHSSFSLSFDLNKESIPPDAVFEMAVEMYNPYWEEDVSLYAIIADKFGVAIEQSGDSLQFHTRAASLLSASAVFSNHLSQDLLFSGAQDKLGISTETFLMDVHAISANAMSGCFNLLIEIEQSIDLTVQQVLSSNVGLVDGSFAQGTLNLSFGCPPSSPASNASEQMLNVSLLVKLSVSRGSLFGYDRKQKFEIFHISPQGARRLFASYATSVRDFILPLSPSVPFIDNSSLAASDVRAGERSNLTVLLHFDDASLPASFSLALDMAGYRPLNPNDVKVQTLDPNSGDFRDISVSVFDSYMLLRNISRDFLTTVRPPPRCDVSNILSYNHNFGTCVRKPAVKDLQQMKLEVTGIKNPPFSTSFDVIFLLLEEEGDVQTIIDQSRHHVLTAANSLLDARLVFESDMAGQEGTLHVAITTNNALLGGSLLSIEHEAGFISDCQVHISNQTSMLSSVCSLSSINFSTSYDGKSIPAGQTLEFDISSVRNPKYSGGFKFTIRTFLPHQEGIIVDTKDVIAQIRANVLLNVSITSLLTVSGDPGEIQILFRPSNEVPYDGIVQFDLMEGFLVHPSLSSSFSSSSSSSSSWSYCSMIGIVNLTTEVLVEANRVSFIVKDSRPLPALQEAMFRIPSVSSQPLIGDMNWVYIQTQTSAGRVIDFGVSSLSVVSLDPNKLPMAAVLPLVREAGSLTSVAVSLQTKNEIPDGGFVVLRFPQNLTLLQPSLYGHFEGFDGMLQLEPPDGNCTMGCQVRIRVSGSYIPSGRQISFIINNVKNMPQSGVTGSYFLQTTTADGIVIDEGSSAGTLIEPSRLGFVSVSCQEPCVMETTVTLTISFATSNHLMRGSVVELTFPPEIMLAETCNDNCENITVQGDGISIVAVSLQENSLILLNDQNLNGGDQVTFDLSGVSAPKRTGRTGRFQIRTKIGDSTVDEDVNISGFYVDSRTLSAEVSCDDNVAAKKANYSFHLRFVSSLPINSTTIALTLPDGVQTDPTSSIKVTSEFEGTIDASVQGQTFRLSFPVVDRRYLELSAISFSLSDLQNPPVSGVFEFLFETVVSDAVLGTSYTADQGSASLQISPEELQDVKILPDMISIGFEGAVTIQMTTLLPLPSNFTTRISFPSFFGISHITSVRLARFANFDLDEARFWPEEKVCFSTDMTVLSIEAKLDYPVEADVTLSFTVSSVELSGYTGAVGDFDLVITSGAGVYCQQTAPYMISSASKFAGPSISFSSQSAGDITDVLLSFTYNSRITPISLLFLSFPEGFSADSNVDCVCAAVSCVLVDVSAGNLAENGFQTLKLSVMMQTISDGLQDFSLRCSGLRSRPWNGTTTLLVQSLDNSGNLLQMEQMMSELRSNHFRNFSLEMSSHTMGTLSDLSMSMTTSNALPHGGLVELQLPSCLHFSDLSALAMLVQDAEMQNASAFSSSYEQTSVSHHTWFFAVDQLSSGQHIEIKLSNFSQCRTVGRYFGLVRTRISLQANGVFCSLTECPVVDEFEFEFDLAPLHSHRTSLLPVNAVAGEFRDMVFETPVVSNLSAVMAFSITFPPEYDISRVSTTSGFEEMQAGDLHEVINNQSTITIPFKYVGAPTSNTSTTFHVRVVNVGIPRQVVLPLPIISAHNINMNNVIHSNNNDDCVVPNGFIARVFSEHLGDVLLNEIVCFDPIQVFSAPLSAVGTISIGSSRDSLPRGPGNILIQPQTVISGLQTSFSFSFFVTNRIPSSGALVIVLPHDFHDEGGCSCSSDVFEISSCVGTPDNLTLSILSGVSDNTKISMRCEKIRVRREIGNSAFLLFSRTESGAIVDDGTTAVTVSPGSLSPYRLDVSSSLAGDVSLINISFTLGTFLLVGDNISFYLPHGFVPAGSIITEEGHQSPICALSSSILATDARGVSTFLASCSLDRSLDMQTKIFARFTVTNRGWEGPVDDVRVAVRTGDNKLVAQDLFTVPPLTYRNLTSAGLIFDDVIAGAVGTATVSFLTQNVLYADSKISIHFPVSFAIDDRIVPTGLTSGIDGEVFCRVQGEDLVIYRKPDAQPVGVGTRVVIEFTGIRVKGQSDCVFLDRTEVCSATGGTATISILAFDSFASDQAVVDLSPVKFALLERVQVSLSAPLTGAEQVLQVNVRLANQLPSDGSVVLSLPTGYQLSPPLSAAPADPTVGRFLISTLAPLVFLLRRLDGAALAKGFQLNFNLSGVRSRRWAGDTGTYQIRTLTADRSIVDAHHSVPGSVLAPGPLQLTQCTTESDLAGVTTRLHVRFAVANPLPPDGSIELLLPQGFSFPFRIFLGDTLPQFSDSLPPSQLSPRTATIDGGIMEGKLEMEVMEESGSAKFRRYDTNQTVLPCPRSRPEVELEREKIAAGCDAESSIYLNCTVEFAVDFINNGEAGERQGRFVLRTLLANGFVVDEGFYDAKPLKPSGLLGSRIEIKKTDLMRSNFTNSQAGTMTSLFLTLMSPTTFPRDGKLQITFPQGFNLDYLTLGQAEASQVVLGLLPRIDSPPDFDQLFIASSSDVVGDLTLISLNFSFTFEPPAGSIISISNLGNHSSALDSFNLECPGSKLVVLSPVRSAESVSFTLRSRVQVGQEVKICFWMQNPREMGGGSSPAIILQQPMSDTPCGLMNFSRSLNNVILQSIFLPEIMSAKVQVDNWVRAQQNTISVSFQCNFTLVNSTVVLIQQLPSSPSPSTDELEIMQNEPFLSKTCRWRSVEREVQCVVTAEKIAALTWITFSFVLRSPDTYSNSEQHSVLRLSRGILQEPVTSSISYTLVSSEMGTFAVKRCEQNSEAYGAINRISVFIKPTAVLSAGSNITISGLRSTDMLQPLICHPTDTYSKFVFDTDHVSQELDGSLVLALRNDLSDVIEASFYFFVINPSYHSEGVHLNISSDATADLDTPMLMDGKVLATSQSPSFVRLEASYSNVAPFEINMISLVLSTNFNLPPLSQLRLSKLPALDSVISSNCRSRTVGGTPCSFPFDYLGRRWYGCVDSFPVNSRYPAPSTPWCAIQADLGRRMEGLDSWDLQSLMEEEEVTWGYCECDGNQTQLHGESAKLFGEVASWDGATSSVSMSVGRESFILPGQELTVSLFVRNGPSTLEAATAALKPFVDLDCSTIALALKHADDVALKVSEAILVPERSVLIKNVSSLSLAYTQGPALYNVTYCTYGAALTDNSYGFQPWIEAHVKNVRSVSGRLSVSYDETSCKNVKQSLSAKNASTWYNVLLQDDAKFLNGTLPPERMNFDFLDVLHVNMQLIYRAYPDQETSLAKIDVLFRTNTQLMAGTVLQLCCFPPSAESSSSLLVALQGKDADRFDNSAVIDYETEVLRLTVMAGKTITCDNDVEFSFWADSQRVQSFYQQVFTVYNPNLFYKGSVLPGNRSTSPAFLVKNVQDSTDAFDSLNLITVEFQTSVEICYPTIITISQLSSTATSSAFFHWTNNHPYKLYGEYARYFDGTFTNVFSTCSSPSNLDCKDNSALMLLSLSQPGVCLDRNHVISITFYLRNRGYFTPGNFPTISLSARDANDLEYSISEQGLAGGPVLRSNYPQRFSDASILSSTSVMGSMNKLTFSLKPNFFVDQGSNFTISGFVDVCRQTTFYLPECSNAENPSSNFFELRGKSANLFGRSAKWDRTRGQIFLSNKNFGIPSGYSIEITFYLKNGCQPSQYQQILLHFAGKVKTQLGTFEAVHDTSRLFLRRMGDGEQFLHGETISLSLASVRLPSKAGYSGDFSVETQDKDGQRLSYDNNVRGFSVDPSSLNARLTPSPLRAGAYGEMQFELETSNEVPANGLILISFPAGYELCSLLGDQLPADQTNRTLCFGLTVVSQARPFTLSIGTEFEHMDETSFGTRIDWPLSVLLTNKGEAILPHERISFVLKGLRFPSFLSDQSKMFQIRTLTERQELIDQDLSIFGDFEFGPGQLRSAAISFDTTIAGEFPAITIELVTSNPLPPSSRIDVEFPAGYQVFNSLTEQETSKFGFRCQDLDSRLRHNISVSPATSPALVIWLDGTQEVPPGVVMKLRISVFSPQRSSYPYRMGLQNPRASGRTGEFVLRTRNGAGDVIDYTQVIGVDILPGVIKSAKISLTDAKAGERSGLRLFVFPTNEIPSNFSMRLVFSEEDFQGIETEFVSGDQQNVTYMVNNHEILVRFYQPLVLVPCLASSCTFSATTLQDSLMSILGSSVLSAAYNLMDISSEHYIQYSFTGRVLACGYSFESRIDNKLLNDSFGEPSGFVLEGSNDGSNFDVIERVVNSSSLSSKPPTFSHFFPTPAFYQHFRITITSIFGDFSHRKQTLVQDWQMLSCQNQQALVKSPCSVQVELPEVLRNRNFSGLTRDFTVELAGADGTVIDRSESVRGPVIAPNSLQGSQITLSSLLAGDVSSVNISFVPHNPIPQQGHLEICFPPGFVLDSAALESDVLTLSDTHQNRDRDPCLKLSLASAMIGAGSQVAVSLSNVRLPPRSGPTGTYQIKTFLGDDIIDSDLSVTSPDLTIPDFLQADVILASNVVGDLSCLELRITPSNPIPSSGLLILSIPTRYQVLQPIHARWLGRADLGLLVSTYNETTGELRMSRYGGREVNRSEEVKVQISSLINKRQSGSSGSFQLCAFPSPTGPASNCVPPQCKGCEADESHIQPLALVPPRLEQTTVTLSGNETGSNGLQVAFVPKIDVEAGSSIVVSIPASFRVGEVYIDRLDMKCKNQACQTFNGTLSKFVVSTSPAGNCTDCQTITISSLPRISAGCQFAVRLRNIRNPVIPSVCLNRQFDVKIFEPLGSLAQFDYLQLRDDSVVAGRLNNLYASYRHESDGEVVRAGDVVNLFLQFETTRNYYSPEDVISLKLADDFECHEDSEVFLGDGNSNVSTASYGQRLNGGCINSTSLNFSLASLTSGTIRVMISNIRVQTFSGFPSTFRLEVLSLCQLNLSQSWTVVDASSEFVGSPIAAGILQDTGVNVLNDKAGVVTYINVTFTLRNSVPPGSSILLALPARFKYASRLPTAYLTVRNGTDISRRLKLDLPSEGLVSMLVETDHIPQGSIVSAMLHEFKIPPRSKVTSTFQLRTILENGHVIDEDLQVGGIPIAPGSFLPSFVAKFLPDVLMAGHLGNFSVQFMSSNDLPSDGKIVLYFYDNFRIDGVSLVVPSSVFDKPLSKFGIQTALDGGLGFYVESGNRLVVQRDGNGRDVLGGELISLTVVGVENQFGEGLTSSAKIDTRDCQDYVIDVAEFPPLSVPRSPFLSVSSSRYPNIASSVANWTITIELDGHLLPASILAINMINETNAGNELLQVINKDVWNLTLVTSRYIEVTLHSSNPLPPRTPLVLELTGMENSFAARSVEYNLQLLSSFSRKVSRSSQFVMAFTPCTVEPMELSSSVQTQTSNTTWRMSFQTRSPISALSSLQLTIPPLFSLTPTASAMVLFPHGSCDMQVNVENETIVDLGLSQASCSKSAKQNDMVTIQVDGIVNRPYAGIVPGATLVVFDESSAVVERRRSGEILVTVSQTLAPRMAITSDVCGALTDLSISFTMTTRLPVGARIAFQLPAFFSFLPSSRFLNVSGLPFLLEVSTQTLRYNLTHAFYAPAQGGDGPLLVLTCLLDRSPSTTTLDFTLTGVKNRPWTGPSGSFSLTVFTSTMLLIQQDANVRGYDLHVAPILTPQARISSFLSLDAVSLQVAMTLSNALPPSSLLRVNLSSAFRVGNATVLSNVVGFSAELETAATGTTSLLLRTAGVPAEGEYISFALSNVEVAELPLREQ